VETKGYELLLHNKENLLTFGIGTIVSFIVAMIAIKSFITFLQKHGFRVFGIYRIIAGLIMLLVLGVKYF
jgi:undecaprenyl-diphosphatase